MSFITQKWRTLLLAAVAAVAGLSGCIVTPGDPADPNTQTTWTDWTVTAPATCDAPGVETRTDTKDANHRESRVIAQLTGAACNTGGGGEHVHTWGDWAVTTPATCNAPGEETRTCTQDASHKETRAIAQLTGSVCNTGGGGSYEFVTIGGKKWMTKNLNIETSESWCYGHGGEVYDYVTASFKTLPAEDIQANCAKYGRLYTWSAAKTACPIGWRLPSREEWDDLVTAAGGYSTAGKKLKSTSGWNYNGAQRDNGTDDFGFSALPGGYRNSDGNFITDGYHGYWWTAAEYNSEYAYFMSMEYGSDIMSAGGDGDHIYKRSGGFSVRCVGGDHVHTWGAWAVTTQATCNAPGVETRTCTQDASHKETRPIAQLTGAVCNIGGGDHVHTWGAWVVTIQATCNAPGVETRTCTQDASHKETRPIAQLTGAACNTGGGDHVHTWGAWTVITPATCNTQGVETRTCTQDASHKEVRVIAQLTGTACNSGGGDHVHTWSAWVVTTPATCNAPGVETRTCTQDASHKETQAIAQLTGAACNTGTGNGATTKESAILVSVGFSSSYNIAYNGEHWFKFVGIGEPVMFETRGNVVDTYIDFYVNDGGYRRTYDDNSGEGSNALVSFNTDLGETYYIKITPQSGTNGLYTFVVTKPTFNIRTNPITVVVGNSSSHTMYAGGTHWFKFVGDGKRTFFETGGNVVNTNISIYKGDDDRALYTGRSGVNFITTSGQIYYISITGNSGTYDFKVFHGTGDGSSRYYAKEVESGYSASHTINYKGENWFIYQGTGLPVIFETRGNVVDTYIDFYINDGGYQSLYDDNSGDGSNALYRFDSVVGDNYFIKVTPQSGTSGTYTFIVK